MRDVSRAGLPAAGCVPATLPNQSASTRWTETTSTIKSSPRHRSTTSSTKKSGGHSSSRAAPKCPPRLSATSHAETAVVAAVAHADVYPNPSDKEQLGNFSSLRGCQCPDSTTRSVCRSAYHNDTSLEMPIYSHSSSASLQSSLESESMSLLSTSSSRGSSRFHEPGQVLQTSRSFWENCLFARGKPQRQQSFLSILWNFKSQTKKVEESADPILVSVNVMGSPGPLRLVVDKKASVHQTVDLALERYAGQRRLPALEDPSPFFGLYCRNPDFEALDDEERIGDRPARQFHLYHKQGKELEAIDKVATATSRLIGTPVSTKNWIWDRLSRMKSWVVNVTSYFSYGIYGIYGTLQSGLRLRSRLRLKNMLFILGGNVN